MASVNMSIRVDPELKAQAEALFDELGLTMNGAINMFLKQSVRDRAVPLSLSLGEKSRPHEDLLHAIEERQKGYVGDTLQDVLREMDGILSRVEAERLENKAGA